MDPDLEQQIDQGLTAPHFVLAQPRWITAIAGTLFLVIGAATLIGVSRFWPPEAPAGLRYILGTFGVAMLAISLLPRTWKTTPKFMADRRGIHIVCRNGQDFLFVPWEDVGALKVGWGEGRVRNVLVEIRVTDDQWEQLTGASPNFSGPPPRSGFREVNMGNACRNPEETLARIEAIRRAAATVDQGSPPA